MTEVVFSTRGDGTLAASVRDESGVGDVELRGELRCSCRRLGCAHLRRVRAALSLTDDNDRNARSNGEAAVPASKATDRCHPPLEAGLFIAERSKC